MAFLIASGTYLAWTFHGGKVLVGIGIGLQFVGFIYMMFSRTTVYIRDRDEFDKIFNMIENTEPKIEGPPMTKYIIPGIWFNIFGLAFQLTGLFLF